MKKIFLLLFILPLLISAQYVSADFVVLNDGMDASYNDIEKVWKVFHQQAIKRGDKIDWSVWKRTAKENDNENAADYVIFNNFSSKAQYDKTMSNFNYNQAVTEMKMGLKGKISSSKINKILQKDVKKQVRNYRLELVDATPLVGGDLKVGDKMDFSTMSQLNDDYEEYESEVWKPMFVNEIMKGNFRWWAMTKIVDRNEDAYKKPTHLVWNIGVENQKPFEQKQDFISRKMRDSANEYREMGNPSELVLIYTSN